MNPEAILDFIRSNVTPVRNIPITKGSAAAGLIKQMEGKHFGTILEIGTCMGVSAAILACYADTVITLDIEQRPEVRSVLDTVGLGSKVIPIVVANDASKARLVDNLGFDMAFIDGGHKRQDVCCDFAMTSGCGTVLFHDYPTCGGDNDGAGYLLDELMPSGIIERCPPFAWWRAKK